MKPSPAAPEVSAEDLERFQIHSRIEIVTVLRALIERRAQLTVHYGQGEEFMLSTLVAVNPDYEELVFDCSGDQGANARLLRSPRLNFVSSLEQVRIQFSAQRAEATAYDGLPAFRVRIPDALLRLQRRDYFRIAPPLASALVARIADPRESSRTAELRILDISAGGIAVADVPQGLRLETGMVLEQCAVQLPDVGAVSFKAEVCNVVPNGAPGGAVRCGLRYLDMPGAIAARIQRYILKLDRDRRNRL
jgi:c-di-GMP-binding flagellar brake protein YcgR